MYAPTTLKEKLSFWKGLATLAAVLFMLLFLAGGAIRLSLWTFDSVTSLFF